MLPEALKLIRYYFLQNYTASEISSFLLLHGIKLGVRQLRRILKTEGLLRRKAEDFTAIVNAIQFELAESGSCCGYRSMWQRLRTYHGLSVRRDTVQAALSIIDPDGVALRKARCLKRRMYYSKGPNYMVHIDGYDKLKPYGFPIHGAIDGYSRRVLWLKIARSNNDPRITASHYLDYCKQIGGVPRAIRIDCGTENVRLSDLQKAFRLIHQDSMAGDHSVITGRSVANQRIERWWGILRHFGLQYWINLFKDLVDSAVYSPADNLQLQAFRFSFKDVLQQELNKIAEAWNIHNMRPVNNAESPSGKPDMLFFMPELKGAKSYMKPVRTEDFDEAAEFVDHSGDQLVDPNMEEVFVEIMHSNGWKTPGNAMESAHLYAQLMDALHANGYRI